MLMNKQILELPFATQEQKYEYWEKSKEYIKQSQQSIAALEERIKSVESDKARLLDALNIAINSTDDYDIIDRNNGIQYFKHEIFKSELELIAKMEGKS